MFQIEVTEEPTVGGTIAHSRNRRQTNVARVQRASMALWVLLRSLPLGATRNQILGGPA